MLYGIIFLVYASSNYAFRKPKPITIPAVSVLRTLSQKRANMKPLSCILTRSASDQPPSGPTQSPIFWRLSYCDIRILSQMVSSTICDISIVLAVYSGNLSMKAISGITTPPHCSRASRAIMMNLSILVGDRSSFCERSERKNTNLAIPISTHFWRIYSIFSCLFGSA